MISSFNYITLHAIPFAGDALNARPAGPVKARAIVWEFFDTNLLLSRYFFFLVP